ncbi:hypothetical protein BU16DRAFT_538811 [Lophium mytilinum]|uniref:Uncharacterized protein n=1 Tax=Lophium mytilinum TaxID=390894 RepID=A0A6A6QUZ3_9PEZI|nr:hypothetical protein BU16DRAFT_538811 [Lophium mytilinum]
MPWSAFLKEECCWQLAHLYTKATPPAFWDDLTVEALEAVAPLLISWKYRDAYSDQLLEQLKSIVEPVSTTYEENRPRRRREKNDQAAAYSVRQLLLASTLKGYNTQVRVRDNSLAALD